MRFAIATIATTLVLGAAVAAYAADECCPTDGTTAQPAAPTMSSAAYQLVAQAQQMPEGHPPVGQEGRGAIGTLVIKAKVDGEDGEPAANAPVQIEFYQKGNVFHRLNAKLDAHGVVMIEDIAIKGVVQPVINLTYEGVTYREIAHPMAEARPDQVVKMTVYHATEEKPDFTVKMRHVIVRPGPHGVEVTEMLLVDNPTKLAWVGEKQEEGDPVTMTMPIPENAKFVQFGRGIDATRMQIEKGQVLSHLPLLPGSNELSVGYVIPVKEGAADIPIGVPNDVSHMMLFISAANGKATVTGMTEGQTMQGQDESMRTFQAMQLEEGSEITVKMTEVKMPKPMAPKEGAMQGEPSDQHVMPAGPASEPQDPGETQKFVAGIGGAGLLIAAGVLIVYRTATNKKAA